MTSIAGVTPTVCALMGLSADVPDMAPAYEAPLARARELGIETVEKTLLYAPDAVGLHLHTRFPQAFVDVARMAPVTVDVKAALPSVTPVCFATMFTGLSPDGHGLRTYAKPVVRVPTLFDHVLRAGRRAAIVAVEASSMARIFQDRDMTYVTGPDDEAVTAAALALLEEDEHDLVVVYHQAYDDAVHASGPFSTEAVEALEAHLADFDTLAKAVDAAWAARPRLLGFIPDHGAHTGPDGRGTHGEDLPDDLDVRHYFGVYPAGGE